MTEDFMKGFVYEFAKDQGIKKGILIGIGFTLGAIAVHKVVKKYEQFEKGFLEAAEEDKKEGKVTYHVEKQ